MTTASAVAPRKSLPFLLTLFSLALLLFAGLASYMRSLERRALSSPAIRDQLTAQNQPRPLAQVSRALRQAKLVTVEIDTRVVSESAHDSWRGGVNATVIAPVRLLYGADLSKLSAQSLAFSPADGGYLIRIPAPERLATEVCTDAESIDLQLGWLRLRSRAGEYYLGLARRDLYKRARELTLSPDDARMVRRATKEQTAAAVKKIVGQNTPVTVAFEDGQP